MADVEQPGILARPQMLGDDAFILDRHLIARERHHPRAPASGAIGRAQAFERLGRACRITVDFVAHRALRSGDDSQRLEKRFGHRPRLSLRLRALPLRRPAFRGLFPDCQARAVLWPEKFRGRLLLRRRLSCTLSRAAFRRFPAGDAAALAARDAQVNASRCSAAGPGSSGSRPDARRSRWRPPCGSPDRSSDRSRLRDRRPCADGSRSAGPPPEGWRRRD